MRNGYGRQRLGYWGSLVRLLTHLFGTALMFSAILVLAWGMSYLVSGLNARHEFPPEIYGVITTVELWLVYIDVAVSGVVFLFGAARFIQDVWEER